MLALFYLLNPNTKIGIFPFDTLTRSDSLTSLAQPTYFFSSFFQVQILMEAVSYIDQLHHKLLHQIHSVGLPPQLIKGEKVFFMNFHSICSIVQNYLTRHVHIKKNLYLRFLHFYLAIEYFLAGRVIYLYILDFSTPFYAELKKIHHFTNSGPLPTT